MKGFGISLEYLLFAVEPKEVSSTLTRVTAARVAYSKQRTTDLP